MNLVDMKRILVEQNQQRGKLLGRKDLLMENLTKLGFKTISTAQKKIKILKSEKAKMQKQYDSKFTKFTEKYEHLL